MLQYKQFDSVCDSKTEEHLWTEVVQDAITVVAVVAVVAAVIVKVVTVKAAVTIMKTSIMAVTIMMTNTVNNNFTSY